MQSGGAANVVSSVIDLSTSLFNFTHNEFHAYSFVIMLLLFVLRRSQLYYNALAVNQSLRMDRGHFADDLGAVALFNSLFFPPLMLSVPSTAAAGAAAATATAAAGRGSRRAGA